MNLIDISVIAVYFVLVIGVGFWYQARAARGLDSYFLGGKSIHWLALAISGASSNFDVTGTMWIVTLIGLFGFKSMWNHWMWGFLMGAFFMSFMGKWVRRSGVITGAEWMITRFGNGPGGRTARTAYALMAVVTLAAFLGYGFEGIGKFVSVYFPAYPQTCAAVIFGVTTLYVLLGGLYSVVVTDIIQTAILTTASIVIAVLAYLKLSPSALAALPEHWNSLLPAWRLDNAAALPEAYQGYEFFGALVIVWVLKGLLLNFGGPAQMSDFQRFLAARDARDAALVGAGWSVFLIVRWAMATGIALLALSAGANYVSDPEKFMPTVLQDYMPIGFRGLVIAGLLAAFMASFSAMVNAGASYIVRDFWQPLVFPKAGPRHQIIASYVATLALVGVGILIGLQAESIRQVFDWIMMALGGAFAVPNVLRWYWWRTNGWGYAIGTFVGLLAALLVPFGPKIAGWLTPATLAGASDLPLWVAWLKNMHLVYVSFPTVLLVSLVGTVAATLLTPPTDRGLLVSFYRHVRPFGWWGEIRREARLSEAEENDPAESAGLAILNTALGAAAILGAYLAPMYLVGHWHQEAAIAVGVAAAAIAVLYFTWYRTLPPREAAEGTSPPGPPATA